MIRQELPSDHARSLHPSVTEIPATKLTNVLQQEVERVAAGKPLIGGVDLSRYQDFEQVSQDSDVDALRHALRTAYANTTYLRGRQMNITLLEELGRNAWLIGNSQLEDVQRRLENELTAVKSQSESINRSRKALQEDSRGELLGLEETWKQGIGKIIETQVASDALRQDLA